MIVAFVLFFQISYSYYTEILGIGRIVYQIEAPLQIVPLNNLC